MCRNLNRHATLGLIPMLSFGWQVQVSFYLLRNQILFLILYQSIVVLPFPLPRFATSQLLTCSLHVGLYSSICAFVYLRDTSCLLSFFPLATSQLPPWQTALLGKILSIFRVSKPLTQEILPSVDPHATRDNSWFQSAGCQMLLVSRWMKTQELIATPKVEWESDRERARGRKSEREREREREGERDKVNHGRGVLSSWTIKPGNWERLHPIGQHTQVEKVWVERFGRE